MPATAERIWQATPRQREFLRATEDEVLYGGAAGGGKTDALLILAAVRCGRVAGAHVLYLRREFPDLEMSAIKRSLELFSGTGPVYNASAHRWTWPTGSRLQFGHLQRDQDVYQYQSAEFDLICFDELTQFSEDQYRYMLSRNRTTRAAAKPVMRSATNPGGVGHAWVRSRFVDVAPHGSTFAGEDGRTRRFVAAKLDDNPHLLVADPGYVARLGELPDEQRKALRDGSWDVFAGAAFAEWRYDTHTCEPFSIPPEWQRFSATDWGYNDGCATLWYAVDPDSAVWIYRERYARGVGAEETGREIVAVGADERIAYRVVGADVDQRRDQGPTIGELLRKGGLAYRTADMSAGSRVQGAQIVHDWLRVAPGADGAPTARLRVFRTCLRLIREIPALVYDSHRPEDVDDDSAPEGHADLYAALRYGLMSRPHPARIERPKPGPGTLGHVRELARKARAREEALGWKG